MRPGNVMDASTRKQIEAAGEVLADYCQTWGVSPEEAIRALWPKLDLDDEAKRALAQMWLDTSRQ
jgi:hypothetical protein